MMRLISSGLRALALCVLGGAFCEASVVQYTVNFGAANDGGAAPTGGFAFNTATNLFESFAVDFRGVSLDLQAKANAPFQDGALPCLGGATGGLASFRLFTENCAGRFWMAQESSGTLIFRIGANQGTPTVTNLVIATTVPLGPGIDVVNNGQVTGGDWSAAVSEVPEPSLAAPLAVLLGVVARRHRRLEAAR